MSILAGRNVAKSFGAFDVFSELNFTVAKGDKIALVGPNGCGKTTLLRIMAAVDEPSGNGTVSLARGVSRGYLAQTAEDAAATTVWEQVQSAFVALNAARTRLDAIEAKLGSGDAALLEQYGTLQHEFEAAGGYEIEPRIKRVLSGLGFSDAQFHIPLSHLSGGQRVRSALARLLLFSPDILLLDEPTNHLDAQGIEWLESFLQDWEGTLIIVSHDRYFLDEVCDTVWEMHRGSDGQSLLDAYRGGYTEYVAQRAARRERALKDFEAQRDFVKKQEEFIRRNMNSQLTAQARGRKRRLDRLELLEKPLEQRALALRLNATHRSGDRVLMTEKLALGYPSGGAQQGGAPPGRLLFRCPDLLLLRTERAALIGANGTGKTTFLKTVLGQVPPLSGVTQLGASVKVGYFAQAHEGLNPDDTVLQALLNVKADLKVSEARDLLGRFLFSGDDQFKTVGMLSGGERGRVALAKLTLQGANLLLLDEPTNHLDIPSQEVITEALQQFDGTLLFVSHDRYLIAALATQLWLLDTDDAGKTGLTVFKGTYDAWRNARDDDARDAAAPAPVAQAAAPIAPPASALSKNQQQQRLVKLEAVEVRIGQLEQTLNELTHEMALAASDFAKMKTLGERYAQTEREIAAAWSEYERMAL